MPMEEELSANEQKILRRLQERKTAQTVQMLSNHFLMSRSAVWNTLQSLLAKRKITEMKLQLVPNKPKGYKIGPADGDQPDIGE
jgi:DNA-binding Lrp family transcriptional regulator